MTNSMLLPIGFSIERLYALKNAENYEKEKIFLGPILVIILVALDFLFIGLIYFDEEFTGPFISLILVPSTSAFQFNIYFYCLLGVQIFNLICNIFTLVFHSKKHRNSQQKTNTLSFQYVMAEVNDSSMFTLVVSFSHLLFAGFYIICGIFARQFGPTFFDNVVDYTVARAVFCSIPSYNFMIVFIGSLILFQQNKKKASKVASNIALVSIGQEGALNYENVTRNIWDRAVN
ncbi:hypothetical protein B9Z55_022111 [Caenorhabditis nigoni]|uniref:Serpentine receptor class gamma n=2 Tax=Caenorhabditis nigoni TaxID=1611254 RepID=A0A2G5TV06_9PELO|nr:hypothetical protein B9Z55_022111 [Caenorhabditis nigoni]